MTEQDTRLASGLLLAPYSGDLPPLGSGVEAAIHQRMGSIPIFKSLGFSQVRLGAGCLECRVARNPEHDGIFDSFHGGLLMTAADSAAAIVSLTVWGADSRITTTDMNIRFLAPARSDVVLFAQAIKQGRTLIPVIANFWRDDGALVAVAQVAYMRLT
jgi:acyl-CoA thioesterase